jgi:hypothetical protein
MRPFAALIGVAAALIACRKADRRAAAGDTSASASSATRIVLADVAGKWIVHVIPDTGGSAVLTFTMVTTGDSTGWSNTFPNGQSVPVRVVSVAGDSVVTETGPHESALRKGVQVKTHSVSRLQNGKLVGTTDAHYQTAGPDSVRHLRFEGTRAP